jgi:ubiquinone/menaquinone biosynthesis C-methylase UbiE
MTHNKLDNEWRRQNLPPYSTLDALGLKQTDIVADVGCGIGYFTIPIADIIDKKNKIYALDISDDMLDEVERRAVIAKLDNIITVKVENYDLKLPNGICSFALIANVLHEIDDKERFLSEIKRIIKQGGTIAIIEWDKKPMEKGPPLDHRIDRAEVIRLLELSGLKIIEQIEFSDCFYGIIAISI